MPPKIFFPIPLRSLARRATGGRWAAGLLFLIIHIAVFTVHTDRAARSFDACAVPPNTIPGLPEPRFFPDNDPYAWMAHTRDLMASNGWRIRWTFMDNAPYGREMHWSHPLIWTLRGMATGIIAVTGWPVARAVELAGIWVMPLFQFLFLGLAWVVLTRKQGWFPGGLFVFLCLSLTGFANAFYPLLPDHHGLQLVTGLFSFICLQLGGMGWTRTGPTAPASIGGGPFRLLSLPPPREARRWFIASGVFGGLALWLGATVWLFGLAITSLAAATALPALLRPALPGHRYSAGLWRIWAFVGSAVAAGGYLLEYAPAHFAMRLEVNHPLYWLCWIGVAECLRVAGRCASLRFWQNRQPADWIFAALGLLAALALPFLALYGPKEWHYLHDPLLQRLHANFINEFQTAWASIRNQPIGFFYSNFGLLPLVVAGTLLAAFRSWRRPQDTAAFLRPAIVFAALYFLLMLSQMRWGFFAAGALIWLGILPLSTFKGSSPGSRKWAYLVAGTLLLNGLAADVQRWRSENRAAVALKVPSGWIQASLSKRRALQWGLAAGTNEWRMVGMATEAPILYYYTGIRTVASYYWENMAGWHAEAAFFTDVPAGERARKIARERGLTHAFAKPTETLPRLFNTIQTGKFEPADLQQSLAGQLAFPTNATLPAWIRRDAPLSAMADKLYAFRTPEGLIGEITTGQIFRLVPDREPSEGAAEVRSDGPGMPSVAAP